MKIGNFFEIVKFLNSRYGIDVYSKCNVNVDINNIINWIDEISTIGIAVVDSEYLLLFLKNNKTVICYSSSNLKNSYKLSKSISKLLNYSIILSPIHTYLWTLWNLVFIITNLDSWIININKSIIEYKNQLHSNDNSDHFPNLLNLTRQFTKFKTELLKTELHNKCICINEYNTDVNLFDVIKNYIDKVDTNWNYILPPILYNQLSNKTEKSKLFLLDIRKKNDFEQNGHIDGSINIFWKDLFRTNNLLKLPCPKHNNDITIILICYVGHTASQTMVLLRLIGFRVIVLKFGIGMSPDENVKIKGWIDYNFPIVFGKSHQSYLT